MRENGMIARVVKITRRAPGARRFLASGENLRPDGGVPTAKDYIWAADVTYIKVNEKWIYLSVVMDLYSRAIVGWSLDESRTTATTKRTLLNALSNRRPRQGLMIHTDRGVEYRGSEYQATLRRNGIVHSLSRPGKCTDNAHMESFFHSLKGGLIRGREFRDASELRYTLASYINDYDNRARLHSGIGYHSPIEYELLAALKKPCPFYRVKIEFHNHLCAASATQPLSGNGRDRIDGAEHQVRQTLVMVHSVAKLTLRK